MLVAAAAAPWLAVATMRPSSTPAPSTKPHRHSGDDTLALEAKQSWLEERKAEWETNQASRERRRRESLPPDEPGDAALKREWLRRQRQANEAAAALAQRERLMPLAPAEPDDAALKRE